MTTTTVTMIADKPALNSAGTEYLNLYYIGDYERNGYDDSDFYVVYWNDESGKIESEMYATTRGGMDCRIMSLLKRDISDSVKARISAFIYDRDLTYGTFLETRRVMEPQPDSLRKGSRVRFLKNSRKGSKTPWVAGEAGSCIWQGWFGTFYAKGGYNTKGRHNGRLGVKMDDGRTVWCSMTSVRLDCEPDIGKVELAARRNANALHTTCPGAWWTKTNPNLTKKSI